MVNRNNKKSNNKVRGYQQFRRPLVFTAPKEKERKKIVLPNINFRQIAYAIGIIFVVYFLFFSGKFIIKDIIIEGNTTIPEDKLKSYIPSGHNIFSFNMKKTKAKILEENTEIENVSILKGLPDAVKVVISEHEAKLAWISNGKNYLISSQGIVSKEVPTLDGTTFPRVTDSKNIPVSLGSSLVSPGFVAFVLNINNKFFETTNIQPVRYEIGETTFDLNLYTEAGFYVKFNTMRGSAKQLENLKKVMVEKRSDIKEYVDLRIDGWAYYK